MPELRGGPSLAVDNVASMTGLVQGKTSSSRGQFLSTPDLCPSPSSVYQLCPTPNPYLDNLPMCSY